MPSGPSSKVHKKSPVSVKVTKCPPAHAVEGYGSCERKLPEANGYKPSAITKEGYVSNKDGKWEYVGKKGAAA